MTKTRDKARGFPRRILFIPALAGMLFCAPAKVQAQDRTSGFFSAGYLLALCESDAKGREIVKNGHTACQSYISGVVDYHKLMKTLGTAPTIDFCVPNTEPMKKLQNIVFVYLARNKQHVEFVAAPAVTLALYEYYPCRTKKKSAPRR